MLGAFTNMDQVGRGCSDGDWHAQGRCYKQDCQPAEQQGDGGIGAVCRSGPGQTVTLPDQEEDMTPVERKERQARIGRLKGLAAVSRLRPVLVVLLVVLVLSPCLCRQYLPPRCPGGARE